MSKSHISSNLILRNSLVGVEESMVAYFPLRINTIDVLNKIGTITESNATITENGVECYAGTVLEYSLEDMAIDMEHHSMFMRVIPSATSLGSMAEWSIVFSMSPAYYLGWDSATAFRVSVVGSDNIQYTQNSSGVTFEPGKEYHVGYVIDGINLKLYIDGIKRGERTVASPLNYRRNETETQGFFIGSYYGTTTYPANSSVKDFMLYNRSMTGDEVLQLSLNRNSFYCSTQEVVML